MLNNITIPIGGSKKRLNNGPYQYRNITIEELNLDGLQDYMTPKLFVSIECNEDIKDYTNISSEIDFTSTFVGENQHRVYKSTKFTTTNIDSDTYLIQGFVEDRVELSLRRIYKNATNTTIILSFNEEHCFSQEDKVIRIFIEYNDSPIVLLCEYIDAFTLSCDDFDEDVFSGELDLILTKSVYRQSWLYNSSDIMFYLSEPTEAFQIPITQTYNIAVNDYDSYADRVIEKLVPSFRDTEKDRYTPVTKVKNDFISINEFEYNLHFLKRSGDNWRLVDNALWNGVNDDYTFNEAMFDNNKNPKDYDIISDLVGLLGFTNNEVKYSKSSLKKSFLRLSFYDNEDIERANLLAYYTIFVDSSSLLNRYNRNKRSAYYNDYNIQDNSFLNVLGITTNGYPTIRHDAKDNSTRLDCRINLKKGEIVPQSTEGMHLFLHRQFNRVLEEKTIFLRIDFNHAKFGRTLPLMLPYHYKEDDAKKGDIKTFSEIVEDQKKGGYSLSEFNRFYNIKIKIKNDFENNRYIYWLDDATYNIPQGDNKSKYVINLYEARINTTETNRLKEEEVITTITDYTLSYKTSIVDKDDDIVIFTPKVSYRIKQHLADSGKVISNKSVVSKSSKFNVTINKGTLEEYPSMEDFLLKAPLGKQVFVKEDNSDYLVYYIATKQGEENYNINSAIIVSKSSGKVQIEKYKDYMRFLNSQNNIIVGTAQSKEFIDGNTYYSQDITLELRR